jgi:hypothetical protein
LLVGLANDQSVMGDHSQDEQALTKIQYEWAEARVKGDSSYTRGIESDDCTIVWPDGRIVNKRGDLESMTGDIVFSEFKFTIFGFAYMAILESSSARASLKCTRESKIFSAENLCGPTHL